MGFLDRPTSESTSSANLPILASSFSNPLMVDSEMPNALQTWNIQRRWWPLLEDDSVQYPCSAQWLNILKWAQAGQGACYCPPRMQLGRHTQAPPTSHRQVPWRWRPSPSSTPILRVREWSTPLPATSTAREVVRTQEETGERGLAGCWKRDGNKKRTSPHTEPKRIMLSFVLTETGP